MKHLYLVIPYTMIERTQNFIIYHTVIMYNEDNQTKFICRRRIAAVCYSEFLRTCKEIALDYLHLNEDDVNQIHYQDVLI